MSSGSQQIFLLVLPSHTIKAFFGQTTSLRLYGQQSLQPFTAAIPLGPAIISCHECLLALGCFLPRIERGVPSPSMERHLRPPLRGGYSRVNKGRKPSDEMFISVFETFHLAGSLDNFISSRILHAAALACVCVHSKRGKLPPLQSTPSTLRSDVPAGSRLPDSNAVGKRKQRSHLTFKYLSSYAFINLPNRVYASQRR